MNKTNQQLNHNSFDILAREISERYDPEFLPFSRRIYRMPGYSHPFGAFVDAIANGYASLLMPGLSGRDYASGTVNSLANTIYRYPFWVVPPTIMELARQIDPPQDWDLSGATFGLPIINFILPKGALQADDGEEIDVLTLLLNDVEMKRKNMALLKLPESTFADLDAVLVVTAYSRKASRFCFVVAKVPPDGIVTHEAVTALPVAGNATTDTTTKWTREVMLPLGLTLASLMQACPEWTDHAPKMIKRVRKSQKEVWAPRILGRNYRHQTDRTKTSSSLEGHVYRGLVPTHWRRGHWHTYWIGPGRQTRKLSLIKPVLVNPPG